MQSFWEMSAFVFTIALLAMISPGPDFFIVLKNSLRYTRKPAMMTAFGVWMGVMTHMIYCVAGIAIIITATPWLFTLLRYAGAAYLIWIGLKALFAKASGATYYNESAVREDVPLKSAFMQGYLCNLLNPKATLFFLSIFTQVLNADSSMGDKLWIAFIITAQALVWWPCVVYLFQSQWVQRRFFKIQFFIDKLLGIILILLGIKVAIGF
ncbi:LysE family transporter [Zophobihabitans entericus]|uniref:LysE family translocator n=1 Tax=Zophobihabitans entericus TaxID=1635327 RepID=A0A6G9I9F1_9GAMM|nr:LysE family translocator [Zophobihabitans entericus]QIQ20354.1 LysE family translocator [Zophobihabitans entericus]